MGRAESTVELGEVEPADEQDPEEAKRRDRLAGLASSLVHFTPHGVDQMYAVTLDNLSSARTAYRNATDRAHRLLGDRQNFRTRQWSRTTSDAIEELNRRAEDDTPQGQQARRVRDDWERARTELAYERDQADVFDAEFERRGGWTRAFLATSTGGHVHASMSCQTCNNGVRPTAFQFMPKYSGGDEQSVVADAGYRACTVCFPSAPTGDANTLPTKIFSKDEVVQAKARAEREVAAEARRQAWIAKSITLDGSPLKVEYVAGRKRDGSPLHLGQAFSSERSAVSFYTDHVDYVAWDNSADVWVPKPGATSDYTSAMNAIEQAYALKHGLGVPQARLALVEKADAKKRRKG